MLLYVNVIRESMVRVDILYNHVFHIIFLALFCCNFSFFLRGLIKNCPMPLYLHLHAQMSPKNGMVETPLKNAVFQLTIDEWESIKPEPRKSGGYAFTGNWTHLLSEKIKETNPTCSFTFK